NSPEQSGNTCLLRVDDLLCRAQRRHGRLQILIVTQGLFDEPVEGMGTKYPPPLLWKVAAIDEPLSPAGRSGGRMRAREPRSGGARRLGSNRRQVIGADGDAARKNRRNRKRSGDPTKACSTHSVYLQTPGYAWKPTIICGC